MKLLIDKRASVMIVLLLYVFSFFTFSLVPVVCGDGESWLGEWVYRKSHVIQSSAGAGTNYQIKLNVCYGSGTDSGDTVYLNGFCKADFGDIRFTDNDGETELDYWLEEKTDSDNAMFWVEVKDDLSSSDVTIYVYYGNTFVSTTSDGDATFIFFDDFSGSSVDTNKWSVRGSCSVSDGILILTGVPNTAARLDMNTDNYAEFSTPYNVSIYYRARYNRNSVRMWSTIGLTESDYTDLAYLHYRGSLHEGIISIKDGIYSWTSSDWDSANFHTYEEKYFAAQLECFEDGIEVSNSPFGTVNYPDDDMYLIMDAGVNEGSGVMDADFICIRKCIESEPVHGTWDEKEEEKSSLRILSFTLLDMDDTDNFYAQKKYYTAQYVVTDRDGYADIDYAEFSITQSSNIRATFRFDQDTETFSIESGSSAWDLDSENCSYEYSETIIKVNFKVSPKFNAIEESDLDISAFVIDEKAENDSKTIQTDYFDVVTTLIVTGFNCNDNRGNVGQTLGFSGAVFYADDPSSDEASLNYPPDSEFVAVHVCDSKDATQGSDKTVVNGTFVVSFPALSYVDLEVYHPRVEMIDSGYVDSEDLPTATFITDRIKILTLGTTDTRINVNDFAEIYATAELEYDGQSLGLEDNFTISSVDLVWNGTHFVGTEIKYSVQQKVYDQVEAEETKYGITALDMNSNSVSVVWDRLNVQLTVNEKVVSLNNKAQFTVTIFREYDNSKVSNYIYHINRDGSSFNNPHATSTFTDVSDSEVTRIYDITYVFDETYGLSAITDPNDIAVAWYDKGTLMYIAPIGALVATIVAVGVLVYFRKKKQS